MIQKYFYKITTFELKSCRIENTGALVQYLEKKWVEPIIKNSKLLIFDTLENALNFSNPYDKIWKCIVKNPKKIKLLMKSNQDFHAFWNTKNKTKWLEGNDPDSIDWRIPKGTYGAEKVKLIKKVS